MTYESAFGFQPVARPVVVLSAAIRLRVAPPTDVKRPPTYSVEPFRASVRTSSLAFGFQASIERSARTWARRLLGTPETAVNWPPMYQPPAPSDTTARRVPFTRGNAAGRSPVVRSIGTPPPVGLPMRVNEPPT